MWRPLYWPVNGTVPEIEPSMSIANPPVYSNGNKTVSITMKSNYKWSDGKPITANDFLFAIDLIKAAVKESPANWAIYTPGQFPDTLVSTSEPNASTLVMNLSGPVNPSWFTEDELGAGPPPLPMPSFLWAKTSTSGAVIPPSEWTPANMTKIFNFLTAQNKSLSTYATNPLWQVVDGPYRLTSYNPTSGGFTMVPNASYGGPHVTPMSTFQGVPFTSNAAQFNAIKAGSIDVAFVDYSDVPQLPSVLRSGYNYFGIPDFGMNFANYNFKDTTGDFNNIIAQPYIRQALAHLVDDQGWIRAFMNGAGGRLRAHPDLSAEPVPAVQRGGRPVPVQRADRGQHAEEPRLDRGARRHRHVREGRHGPRHVRVRDSGRHQAGLELHLQHLPGDNRRPGHRLRVQGEAGRHQHHAVRQQLQLHGHQLHRPGRPGEHQ